MYNYHSHTKRCGHAIGNDEEYVKYAIKAHYDGIGFTDHVMIPYCLKENGVRAPYSQKKDYLDSVNKLKVKYKDKIHIYLGFECEWDDMFVKYYENMLETKEVDYLIFGNHYLDFEDGEFLFKKYEVDEYVKRYSKYAIKALNSKLFKIMAHPDLFMGIATEFNEICIEASYAICRAAKENNVALELNCGPANNKDKKMIGNEYRYRYPYKEFWKIAKEVGNTIVIGLDAHSPQTYLNNGRDEIEALAKELNLQITDKLDIESQK